MATSYKATDIDHLGNLLCRKGDPTKDVKNFVQKFGPGVLPHMINTPIKRYGGQTAVHLAAKNGLFECLKLLLKNGGNPDIQSSLTDLRQTPLHFAARNGYVKCLQILLEHGARTNIENTRRETPLQLVKGRPKCEKVLKDAINGSAESSIPKQHGQQQERSVNAALEHQIDRDNEAATYQQELDEALKLAEQMHYKTYKQALKNGVSVALKYIKLLMLGIPRSGKTTMRRRLIGEIINLRDQLDAQPSTGTVDAHKVVVKLADERHRSSITLVSSLEKGMLPQRSSEDQKCSTTWSAVNDITEIDEELHLLFQFIIAGISDSEVTSPSTEHTIRNGDDTSTASTNELTHSNSVGSHEDIDSEDHSTKDLKPDPELSKAIKAFNKALKSRIGREQLKVVLEKTILLNMIDTGGQPAFIEMLPMLTIGPALYLIFFRLDQDLKHRYDIEYVNEENETTILGQSSCTLLEVIFQILSSISCAKPEAKSLRQEEIISGQSQAALLIGTYKDKLQGSPDEVKSEIKKIDASLRKDLHVMGTNMIEAHRELLRYSSAEDDQLILAVDNMTGDEEEVKKIRKCLEDVIFKEFSLPELPASWLMFGLFIRRMGKSTITMSQCEEIGRQLHMSSSDVREAIWFLHHCIGVLMRYPDVEELKDVVICDPQIVFDSVTELFLNAFTSKYMREDACYKFKHKGQFSFKDIQKVSRNLKSRVLPLPQLVKLLEYLNIIARISSSDGSTKESSSPLSQTSQLASPVPSRDENVTYFMPAVLPLAQESGLNVFHSPVDPAPLLIRFKSGIVPVGVFCASIASLVACKEQLGWDLIEPRSGGLYSMYKNRITFRVHEENSYDVILISKPQRYEIHICPTCEPLQHPSHTLCQNVLETVCQTIDRVIFKLKHKKPDFSPPSLKRLSGSRSPYELGFQCPKHPDEDHMAVNRACSGRIDSSLSATELWFTYFESKTNFLCLSKTEVVNLMSYPAEGSKSHEPADTKLAASPHFTTQAARHQSIDQKYRLWIGPQVSPNSDHSVQSGNGIRLRVSTHFHKIYRFLSPYASHWRDIGFALGYLPNELDNIETNVTLVVHGPSTFLSEMLNKWLQCAPSDGRGSKDFATFEALRDALLKVPGTASIAYDLQEILC